MNDLAVASTRDCAACDYRREANSAITAEQKSEIDGRGPFSIGSLPADNHTESVLFPENFAIDVLTARHHTKAICAHIEAVSRGEIPNLLLNVRRDK